MQLTVADRMLEITPEQFEASAAKAFEQRYGYIARLTSYRNDGGWDIDLQRDRLRLLVECKQHAPNKSIGRPVLQKLHSAIITEKADGGVLVTTARFSEPAIEFAEKHGITLFDGDATLGLFKEAFPVKDHPDIVWALCPRCAERVLVDARDQAVEVRCSQRHRVPHPLPDLLAARQQAAYRAALRERKKNVDMETFFARMPERELEMIARAEAEVERLSASVEYDFRWVKARTGERFESKEEAERAASVINEILLHAKNRQALIPELEAKASAQRAEFESRNVEGMSLMTNKDG